MSDELRAALAMADDCALTRGEILDRLKAIRVTLQEGLDAIDRRMRDLGDRPAPADYAEKPPSHRYSGSSYDALEAFRRQMYEGKYKPLGPPR